MCNLQEKSKVPQLPWKRMLPPWTAFLDAVVKNKSPSIKDQCVWHILPIFATGYNNKLPFRLLTKEEVVLVSGLSDHMTSVLSVSNYVSEATVRNIRLNISQFRFVLIRRNLKLPQTTLVCACCSDFLQQHSFENVLTMIDLVGLPSIDPTAIIDFFFYQPDKVSYVAHLNAVREEITNGLWKVGRVATLFASVLSGSERQVERLGILCFVQNGVTSRFQYSGHRFPRWFVFCYVVIETQMLSLITVQWWSYPQGFSLQLDAAGEKWIVEGKHDIEWCTGVHAIGLVKMRCADAVTLFSSHATIYSYVGCPLCGGAAIVSHSFYPIHTNSRTPQVKAIGFLEDSGVLSIAVATSPPSSQTFPVDCDLTDVANGPPAAGAPSASSNNASVSGLQSLAQTQLNDKALVHFVVIVAHASEQRD